MIKPNWSAPENIHAFMTTRSSRLPADISAKINFIQQIHGSKIIRLNNLNKNNSNHPLIEADAVFTTQPDVICAVRTADCLPILVCDRQGTCAAAIHAGWRGLAAGIIENSLAALPVLPQDLLVWLGPAIGPRCFEVGEDMREKFPDNKDQKAFTTHKNFKYLCDIYILAKNRLDKFKLNADQIFITDRCTYTETRHFYSYRRNKAETNRMVSFIWIGTPG